MKTPEEMAEEYANESGWLHGDYVWLEAHGGFLAGYKAAQQWFSVKDSLPEDAMHSVVRTDDGEYQVAWRENGYWFMFNQCCVYDSQVNDVTHWMPLPEPPKEEK